ncbi:MAG: hypothetical protein KC620_14930 [Myxococcales bacterium]|nr:hypothetical protein [Myxococcales bacterium]
MRASRLQTLLALACATPLVARAQPICPFPEDRAPFEDGPFLDCRAGPELVVVREPARFLPDEAAWEQTVLVRFANPDPDVELVASGQIRVRGAEIAAEPMFSADALRLTDPIEGPEPPPAYEDAGDCLAAEGPIGPHPMRGLEFGDLVRLSASGDRIRFEFAAAGDLDDLRFTLRLSSPPGQAALDIILFDGPSTPGVGLRVGNPGDVAPDDGYYRAGETFSARLAVADLAIGDACIVRHLIDGQPEAPWRFVLFVPEGPEATARWRRDGNNAAGDGFTLTPVPAIASPGRLSYVFDSDAPLDFDLVGGLALDCAPGDTEIPIEAALVAPVDPPDGVYRSRLLIWNDADGDGALDVHEVGARATLALVVGPEPEADPCTPPVVDAGASDAGMADDAGEIDAGEADAGVVDGGAPPLDAAVEPGDGGAGDGAGDGGEGDGGAGDGGAGDGGAGDGGALDAEVLVDVGLDLDAGVDRDGAVADAGDGAVMGDDGSPDGEGAEAGGPDGAALDGGAGDGSLGEAGPLDGAPSDGGIDGPAPGDGEAAGDGTVVDGALDGRAPPPDGALNADALASRGRPRGGSLTCEATDAPTAWFGMMLLLASLRPRRRR